MAFLRLMYHHFIYLFPRKQRITELFFLLSLGILFLYVGSNHFEFSTLDKNPLFFKSSYLGVCLEFAKIIAVIYSIFIVFVAYQTDKNRYYLVMITSIKQQTQFFFTKRVFILFAQISSVFHLYLIIWIIPSLFLPYAITISSISSDILITLLQVIFMSLLSELLMLFFNHFVSMIPLILVYWYTELYVQDSTSSPNDLLRYLHELMPIYPTDIAENGQWLNYLFLYVIFLFTNLLLWSKKESY
ncbi:MAG: hypothetical protein AB7U79_05605 [Candidatus Izemoplasmatales bacterium]